MTPKPYLLSPRVAMNAAKSEDLTAIASMLVSEECRQHCLALSDTYTILLADGLVREETATMLNAAQKVMQGMASAVVAQPNSANIHTAAREFEWLAGFYAARLDELALLKNNNQLLPETDYTALLLLPGQLQRFVNIAAGREPVSAEYYAAHRGSGNPMAM